MTTGLTNLSRLRLDAELGAGETVLQAQNGITKLFNRPTTDAMVLQVKGEPTSVSGSFAGVENTIDAHPSTATSALTVRATQSVARLAASHTMTGGALIADYAQICNLGTINAPASLNAASYSLIEDGGTYTAVGHLAVEWLDSHLAQTVSAGKTEFMYITNNGSTTFDNVFYIYAGNKITNLFTIDNLADTGLVGAKVNGDYTFTATRKVKVNVGGETGYIVVDIS